MYQSPDEKGISSDLERHLTRKEKRIWDLGQLMGDSKRDVTKIMDEKY